MSGNYPNPIRPWEGGNYRRYSPSAYDPSMSVYEELVMIREYLNQMIIHFNGNLEWSNSNFKRIYEELNRMIKEIERFEGDVTNVIMPENLTKILNEWFDNGKLAEIINEQVFDMKADKKDLDKLKDYIDDAITFSLDADIDGTTFKKDDKVDMHYLQNKQSILFETFLQRLRNSQTIKIVCQGDSLTYGLDTKSPDARPADTTPNDDGVVFPEYQTMASITYPEALQNRLNYLLGGGKATVVKRGYSGDTAELSYKRWNKKTNANLAIVMLGTNDANSPVSNFINYYERIIVKYLLQDTPVMIIMPPKAQNTRQINQNTFGLGIKNFAEKYGIHVVDSTEFVANYGNIYSDGTHFNGDGYNLFGTKLVAPLIGKGIGKPSVVDGGSKMLMRPEIDSVWMTNYAGLASAGSGPTPPEVNKDLPTVMYLSKDEKICWSFYTSKDDVIVMPYLKLKPSLNIIYELDFGVKQPDYSLDTALGLPMSTAYSPTSYLNYTSTDFFDSTKENIIQTGKYKEFGFHIAKKGWHTITITSVNEQTLVYGLEFINYQEKQSIEKSVSLGKRYFKKNLYDSYSDSPSPVNNTTVTFKELLESIGFSPVTTTADGYFKDTVLKVTIYNAGNSVKSYYVGIGNKQDGTSSNGNFASLVNDIKLNGSSTVGRTLTSVKNDMNNNQIVLNWGDKVDMLSTITIQIA